MKAERRHELKENDLQHMIDVSRAYLVKHGKSIGLVAFAVVAVVVATSLIIRSRATAAEDRWREMRQLAYDTPEETKQSLETLLTMARDTADEEFAMSALMEAGSRALGEVTEGEALVDSTMNDVARRAFEAILARFPANAIAQGVGHLGLATVEGNAFAVDGDPGHKERAAEHLNAVLANSALHTMPFYQFALDRLDRLDETFTQVAFATPPPAAQEGAELVGPPLPSEPLTIQQAIDMGDLKGMVKIAESPDPAPKKEQGSEPAGQTPPPRGADQSTPPAAQDDQVAEPEENDAEPSVAEPEDDGEAATDS